MKKSKLFMSAVLISVLISSAAFADRLPRFKGFPTLGRCNGTNVRHREYSTTQSEILGKLNPDNFVVVLDELITDGNAWYEVDNPFDEGTAFVFGKYLDACYPEEIQGEPLNALIMNLYLTFGINPEKALKLSGRPKKQERETIGSDKLERVNLTYDDFTLEYIDKSLTGVDLSGGEKLFGDFKIGDDAERIINILGAPTIKEKDSYSYQDGEMTFIRFGLKDNKISHMNYQVYYDIE